MKTDIFFEIVRGGGIILYHTRSSIIFIYMALATLTGLGSCMAPALLALATVGCASGGGEAMPVMELGPLLLLPPPPLGLD